MPALPVDPRSLLNVSHAAVEKALDGGAYNQASWSNTFNIGSVDLIAMVVSDAGLASTEPQWPWNASPLGCFLIGSQPRGGWQVMQRSVQWGTDYGARCFGVDCKMPEVYAYFACSIRNRLEMWQSDRFQSPMVEPEQEIVAELETEAAEGMEQKDPASIPVEPKDDSKEATSEPKIEIERKAVSEPSESSAASKRSGRLSQVSTRSSLRRMSSSRTSSSRTKSTPGAGKPWHKLDRGIRGVFAAKRPTKLLDGSRGGQAFMSSIFLPDDGVVYSMEEQARLQLLSVILVVGGLTNTATLDEFKEMMADDFGMGPHLSSVFSIFLPGLIAANLAILGLTLSVFYSLWRHNIFGNVTPYVLQLVSLLSWSSGATGLLMLGGNPRIEIESGKPASPTVQRALEDLDGDFVEIIFGSLHGSKFRHDRGECAVPRELIQAVSRWRFRLVRTWQWWVQMCWFLSFLLLSITLLIAGSRIAVLGSQIMGIALLVLTSMLRGTGLSGPEEWMIPWWKMRPGAEPAVALQGRRKSRMSATGA